MSEAHAKEVKAEISEPKQYTLGQLMHYSRAVEVVESADVVGNGTEVDPKRTLFKFWAKDGSRLLGIVDPLKDYQEAQKKKAMEDAAKAPVSQ